MPTSNTYLVEGLKKSLWYADLLVADIPADKVTHMPHGTMNHPLWCFGHLSLYPDLWLGLLGRDDVAPAKDGWDALFGFGSQCVDDPAKYPTFDEVLGEFRSKHEAMVGVLPEVADEVLARENPHERMRDFFPTMGEAIYFMFANHIMGHLGQVSAWRRCVGLGSVM